LDKEAVIAAISEEMQNKINKVLKERIEEAKKIINNSLDSFKTLVEEQINKLNELREKNIVLILRQRKGIQGTVKTMNTEKNQLEVELSRVTQLINSFKQ
jgi:NhaP-type Na+/H+ and K+/H+ antiporter